MLFKTYKVSVQEALAECANSQNFFKRLKSGRYIFVDSYFCLNRPEYIQLGENGMPELTDHAREHLGDCCLEFGRMVSGGWACDDGHPLYYLETSKPTVSDPFYLEDENKIQEQIEMFKAEKAEILKVAQGLPQGFPGTLDALIKWRGVKEADLALDANVSTKTIQRLRKYDPPQEVPLETVIQLCIGLHLPPVLSGYLLRAAGKTFMTTNLHIAYQLLLSSCYDYSIEGCNLLLTSQGHPPLGRKPK